MDLLCTGQSAQFIGTEGNYLENIERKPEYLITDEGKLDTNALSLS